MSILHDALPELRARFGVERLVLFGSVARGDESPASDVDVLAEFERAPSLFTIFRIEDELAQRLGRRVELTTPQSLPPRVLAHAMKDAVAV